MKINSDVLTTVLGGVGAALGGAQPVINAIQGTPTSKDWIQLGLAIVFAVFGWATNKGGDPTNG